ncbi:MAG: methyl-accepting chemotaxis protein [Gemmatimonadales bacterium]|nr:methyl-accepting chemotaxis protein [Gemmatimonadales bacterium]MDZ4389482.1 methyl-accepting chemotaxis protein [Gemmatimonadales bacterium]
MKDQPSLLSRVTAGTALLLLLVFGMTLLGVNAIRAFDAAVQQELGTLRERTALAQAVTSDVITAVRLGDRLALAPDDPAVRAAADSALAALDLSTHGYAEVLRLTAEERLSVGRITEGVRRLGVLSREGDPGRSAVADTLVDELRTLVAVQEIDAVERARTLAAASEQRRALIWWLFAAALVIGVSSAVSTVRKVVVPLQRLVEVTERVGAGDLRPVDLGPMPRELGLLAAAVQRMSEGLRGVVGSVGDVSSSLTEHASQLSGRSRDLADSASHVSSAISEVSASAEQQAEGMRQTDALLGDLRSAATRSSGAGQRVVAVAEGIRRTAATHQAHLGAASTTLLELHQVVEQTTASVGQLTHAAADVSDFVSLTGELAAQTELLALNAAIEAARAGSTGEGFAVVASEIRQLAETSSEGARRIAKTVATLDEQVRLVAATVAAGTARVSGVEGVAAGVTRALAEIVSAVEEVSQAAGTVAREAAAHRALADRLAATAADVGRSAQGNAHAAQEVTDFAQQQTVATSQIASAADTLVATADRLTRLVRGFRV